MNATMIGLDTAKVSFQVHGINEKGCAELKRRLRRSEVVGCSPHAWWCWRHAGPHIPLAPRAPIAVRADRQRCCRCGRVPTGLGHEVRLIAPEAARPFVKPGRKNDAADAAALCEAARRPDVKFVPVKSLEQQGTLALHAARALLIKQQTMLANFLRSLAAEFGLVAPQGFGRLCGFVALVEAEAGVPETARRALRTLYGQFHAVRDAATELEVSILAHARQDGMARRLATIVANGNDPVPQGTDHAMTRSIGPGIDPITASLIAATATDVSLFRRAPNFAARAGLLTCASARVDRPGTMEQTHLRAGAVGDEQASSQAHRPDGLR